MSTQYERELPLGAIVNGRANARNVELTGFTCEAGSIDRNADWVEFKRCFEHLAEWAQNVAPLLSRIAELEKQVAEFETKLDETDAAISARDGE